MTAFAKALAEIEKAEAEATPGPWSVRVETYNGKTRAEVNGTGHQAVSDMCGRKESLSKQEWSSILSTRDFIASSRNFLTAPRIAALREVVGVLAKVVSQDNQAHAILLSRGIPIDRSITNEMEKALAKLEADFTT